MTGPAEPLLAEARQALARGEPAAAVALFRQAIEQAPRLGPAWHGLGKALMDDQRFVEAEAAFRQAAEVEADPALGEYHIGLLRLLQGDHAGGWPGWEARLRMPAPDRPRIDLPLWDGGPLKGRRLLILNEQGYGDVIQFARFLPAAAARAGQGAQVTFGCVAPLHPLLAPFCARAGIEAVTGRIEPGRHDCLAWVCSLPALLGIAAAEAIPAAPYLAAAPERVAVWRRRRPRRPACIGLVWEGRSSHPQDAERSIAPDLLAPLAALPGSILVGLQRPPLGRAPPTGLLEMDWGPDITDFAEYAAMLAALDAVVTVDTAPAHLAGALGRPGLVLLPRVPDWRWGLGAPATPWYGRLRLVRQLRPGDWSGPIAEAAAILREAAAQRLAQPASSAAT